MAAADIPHDGPQLRLLRLRAGVSQRAVARVMGRRPARVAALENQVKISEATVLAYRDAVHAVVLDRERLTIDDVIR